MESILGAARYFSPSRPGDPRIVSRGKNGIIAGFGRRAWAREFRMIETVLPAGVEDLVSLVRAAGHAVMDVYSTDFEVRGKADDSPVTEADERAEEVILQGLRRLAPAIPVISEEASARGVQPEASELFWLVDPLDGTKEFISRNGEFTVNLALVHRGRPVFGLVLAPALGRLYGGG